jgi:hypothetical protein
MTVSGWQRIGIVATLIWMIGSFFWYSFEIKSPVWHLYEYDVSRCAEKDGPERSACYDKASTDRQRLSQAGDKDFWEGVPHVMLLPPLVLWVLVSLFVLTMRWIRSGFSMS